jgi:hypothetical protein
VARKKLLTTKQGRQYRDPWRSLVGRKHYIPTRTGPRKGVKLPTASPYPMPPAGWPGTEPEWAIYWAHLEMGLKPQQDFIYLADSPGTDSIQVDFLELAIPVAIQVQGEFWHYEFFRRPRARDIQERATLEQRGYTVVWIDEGDAKADPVFFTQEALRGRDHSKGAMGF